jgi:ABC-type sugar transport system ATPase subunit
MVYVTHDQVEAMTMADRIVVLKRWHRAADRNAAWNSTTEPANRSSSLASSARPR